MIRTPPLQSFNGYFFWSEMAAVGVMALLMLLVVLSQREMLNH